MNHRNDDIYKLIGISNKKSDSKEERKPIFLFFQAFVNF